MILDFAVIILLVLIDQLSKFLISTKLVVGGSILVIPNFFALTYVQNRGIAFGMFFGYVWVFVVITVLFLIVIFFILKKIQSKRYLLCRVAVQFIAAGAVGNLIDRAFRGYVVDFFNFYGIWSYVFNVADVCINIGAGLLIIYFVFFDKKKKEKIEKSS